MEKKRRKRAMIILKELKFQGTKWREYNKEIDYIAKVGRTVYLFYKGKVQRELEPHEVLTKISKNTYELVDDEYSKMQLIFE